MLSVKNGLLNVKYSIILSAFIFKTIQNNTISKTWPAYLVDNDNICFSIRREEIGDGEYAI